MNITYAVSAWQSGLFALLLLRSAGFVACLPLPEAASFLSFRLMFALGLSFLMLPLAAPAVNVSAGSFVFEFVLGGICALPFALLVQCASFFGELFDTCRGQNMAGIIDPASGGQESFAGTLLKNFSIMAVFLSGGAEITLGFLFQSVEKFPPSGIPVLEALGQGVLSATNLTLTAATQCFLPLAASFILLELSVQFLTKLIPNLSVNDTFFMKTACGGFILFGFISLRPFESVNSGLRYIYGLIPAAGG